MNNKKFSKKNVVFLALFVSFLFIVQRFVWAAGAEQLSGDAKADSGEVFNLAPGQRIDGLWGYIDSKGFYPKDTYTEPPAFPPDPNRGPYMPAIGLGAPGAGYLPANYPFECSAGFDASQARLFHPDIYPCVVSFWPNDDQTSWKRSPTVTYAIKVKDTAKQGCYDFGYVSNYGTAYWERTFKICVTVPKPKIDVPEIAVNFTFDQGDGSLTSSGDGATVRNIGNSGSLMDWIFQKNGDGNLTKNLSLNPPFGQNIIAGSSQSVTVGLENIAQLAPGSYSAMIAFLGYSSQDPTILAGTDSLAVNLTVKAPVIPPSSCSPSSQNANVNQNVTLTATSGSGTWSAPGGSPSSLTGSSFTTQYAISGPKEVTLTAGGASTVCAVNVAPLNSPTGNISASPNPCVIQQGATQCASSISWSTANVSQAKVLVSQNNQAESDFTFGLTHLAAGCPAGGCSAPWIQASPNYYDFRLYDFSGGIKGAKLAETRVTAALADALPPPAGALSCSPPNQSDINSPYQFSFSAAGGSGNYQWAWPVRICNGLGRSDGPSFSIDCGNRGCVNCSARVNDANSGISAACGFTAGERGAEAEEGPKIDLKLATDGSFEIENGVVKDRGTWRDTLAGNTPLNGVDTKVTFGWAPFSFLASSLRIDCTNDGVYEANLRVGDVFDPHIIENLCGYSSSGTYVVKATAMKWENFLRNAEVELASDTALVTVSSLNRPPSAAGGGGPLATEPNYCSTGPAATVSWIYSDPDGDPQSAYQAQIDDNGSFNSPEVDSGKVNLGGNSFFSGQGALAFNTTYQARVRVWDSKNNVSPWANMARCSGPGCAGDQKSWKTPKHAYPRNGFIWNPANPAPKQNVQFTDQTVFSDAGGVGQRGWAWLFGDGGLSDQQNPRHSYNAEGSFNVTDTVTDKDGYLCPLSQPVSIQKLIPVWKEVSPK